jgi:hypothetical protein
MKCLHSILKKKSESFLTPPVAGVILWRFRQGKPAAAFLGKTFSQQKNALEIIFPESAPADACGIWKKADGSGGPG